MILFGGNTGNQNMNDTWCLNIDKQPFNWSKIETKGDIPAPRVYHSADVCQQGAASGMIVIFGGRKSASDKTSARLLNVRKIRGNSFLLKQKAPAAGEKTST